MTGEQVETYGVKARAEGKCRLAFESPPAYEALVRASIVPAIDAHMFVLKDRLIAALKGRGVPADVAEAIAASVNVTDHDVFFI